MKKKRLEIVDDRYIILHRFSQKILDHLTNARVKWVMTPDNTVALKWTYYNTCMLTLLGIQCPSPIFKEYSFPKPPSWDVMMHQYRIADFAVRNRRAYILAGMGSGKTASALWASDYMRQQGVIKSVLIICPLSVMTDAWLKTVPALFLGKRSILAIHGKDKIANINKDADYHVINFDGLMWTEKELLKKKWDLVIVDESVMVKNAKAKRSVITRKLIAKSDYSWLMTGKPTPQSPLDAHGQLYVMDKYKHGAGWWKELTQVKVSEFKWLNREGWQNIVHQYMQPTIRVETRDCVDLPDLVRLPRFVELTKPQKEAIDILRKEKIVSINGEQVVADNEAVLRIKLLQIANGAVRTGEEDVVEFKPTGRLEVVEEAVGQACGKTIVFAPFKAVVKMIARHLISKGYRVGIVTGDTASRQRQQIFDSIQSDDEDSLQVIVAVPHAMSHGVTLTNADTMVWFSPIDSNDVYRQAIARMERTGQKRSMVVVEIWGSPIEKAMYDILNLRDDQQQEFLELYERVMTGLRG